MKWIPSVSKLFLATGLLVANNFGLAQSAPSGPKAQSQELFVEVNYQLDEAADKMLANVPSAPTASQGSDPGIGPQLSPVLPAPRENVLTALARVRHSTSRLDMLRPIIEPELAKAGLPAELSGMVQVESSAQCLALSPRGARGLWQLMPDTARRYGLTVTAQRDERLDVYKSTRAAALYLRALYAQFGDWSLVFAAYNAGEKTIQRAIDRSGTTDFLQLRQVLPAETRSYVPAVWASFAQISDRGGLRQLGRLPRRGTNTLVFYAQTSTTSLVSHEVGR
jgi:Transglycosylase SLT domain